VLQQLKESRTAIVLGKTHLYRGKNEVPYVSPRAENIRFVSQALSTAVTAEAIDGTLERLEGIARLHGGRSARAPEEPGSFSSSWTASAQEAVRRYPDDPTPRFREMIGRALRGLEPEIGPTIPPPKPVVRAPPPRPTPPPVAPGASPTPSKDRPPLDAA